MMSWSSCSSFFFFNDTATTEIYTLSLHDALPISFFFGEQRVELFRIIISHVVADVAHHAFTIEKDDRRDTLYVVIPRGLFVAVTCDGVVNTKVFDSPFSACLAVMDINAEHMHAA